LATAAGVPVVRAKIEAVGFQLTDVSAQDLARV
jgi:hypothetical protein